MMEPIAPMLATASPPFDSRDHLFEIKWDGVRCLTAATTTGCDSGVGSLPTIRIGTRKWTSCENCHRVHSSTGNWSCSAKAEPN